MARGRRPADWFVPLPCRFERGFERMRSGYAALLTMLLDAGAHRADRRRPGARARSGDVPARRPRFLSRHRWRADPAARARPRRHADRNDRTHFSGGRGQDSRSHSRAATAELIVDNIGLPARAYNLAFTDGSTIGVNDGVDPGGAQGGPCADRRLRAQAARGAAGGIPRGDVLFPGRRHGDPNPQFRSAGADRRAHRRLRPERRICGWPRSCGSASPQSPASPTRIFSRRSMRRRSSPTSIARGRPSSGSTPTPSPPTSMSA